ncbi:MAG: hypothetical protein WD029_08320, partial [Microthrixaceae bacterium]
MPKEPQDFAEVDPEDAEFEHLARIASLLTESDFDRMQPPAEVWESIVSQVALADPLLLPLPKSLQDDSQLADSLQDDL